MKKIILAAAVAALVVAPTAVAGPNANANTRATTKTCNNMKAQMGAASFKALFAPKTQNARAAHRNCAVREARAQQTTRANSSQLCKTWAGGGDATGFEQRFGAGTAYATMFTGPNAHGKCTSTLARMQNAERRTATVNAARACAPGRTNAGYMIPQLAGTEKATQTFGEAFGTDRNAYGKCVSFVAKALQAA